MDTTETQPVPPVPATQNVHSPQFTLATLTEANVVKFYDAIYGASKGFFVNMILTADQKEFSTNKQSIVQGLMIAVTGELKRWQSQPLSAESNVLIRHLQAEINAITRWINLQNRMNGEQKQRKLAVAANNRAQSLCSQYARAVQLGKSTDDILKQITRVGNQCRSNGIGTVEGKVGKASKKR